MVSSHSRLGVDMPHSRFGSSMHRLCCFFPSSRMPSREEQKTSAGTILEGILYYSEGACMEIWVDTGAQLLEPKWLRMNMINYRQVYLKGSSYYPDTPP